MGDGLSHRVTWLESQLKDSGVIAALQIAMSSLEDHKADYHIWAKKVFKIELGINTWVITLGMEGIRTCLFQTW
jgi:hypothetical protein